MCSKRFGERMRLCVAVSRVDSTAGLWDELLAAGKQSRRHWGGARRAAAAEVVCLPVVVLTLDAADDTDSLTRCRAGLLCRGC